MSRSTLSSRIRIGLALAVPLVLALAGCGAPGPGDPDPDPAPAAPTGLAATAGDGEVTLAWNANGESDLDHYNLYRAEGGGSFAEIGETPAGTETFTATGLVNGTSYRFAVDAEDAAGHRSSRSAEASATPVGEVPSEGCDPAAGTGTLDLAIDAAVGVSPAVEILGDGSAQVADASGAVALASGRYLLVALRDDHGPDGAETIGRVYGAVGATVTEVCVEPDATATATVAYALQPASGRAWVSNDLGHRVTAFTAAQLAAPGTPDADVLLDLQPYGFSDPKQMAFDRMGNLWVADFNPARLLVFTPDQLAASGEPTPAVTITSSAFATPWGLAFDEEGTLWVSDWQKDALYGFEREAQLEALLGGEPVELAPDRTIVGNELDAPEFLAFDADGALWVAASNPEAGNGKNDRLLAYSEAQLAASGAPAPAVILEGQGGTTVLIGATGVAFDAGGDLWAMDVSGFMRFDEADLVSGPADPDLDRDGLSVPANLAFDADGRLWIAHEGQDELRLYTPGDAGNGVGWVTSPDLENPQHIAFFPPPADLPIH